jgi:hypothetical protein
VIVNHLPEETRVKMNTTVELGFEVSSDGFPKPKFQWFLNDAPLASESATFNPLVIPNFRFLLLFALDPFKCV